MGKRKRSGSFSKTDDGGAKKSDDCDSQEELDLENVSSLRGIASNSATRCSARVQEKQEKLRREASPSKQLAPVESTCPVSGIGAVTTAAIVNKGSTKHCSPSTEDQIAGCHITEPGTSLSISAGFEEKRKKRNWELWSIEDKQLFFEALNEFGKDFDAIQNYLANKLKPRSKAVNCSQYAPKNKDQVRHFYYRTWNKISKYLHFPLDMKKANQELYGLVNYGELRKKQRVLNSKSAVKLSELIENGITSIKFRGKTCRIKTPVCRALKRLNGLEDVEHTRVPHKVGLEFIPVDGKTWRSVQSMSHNPRAKVLASLQRTLASVISYFEEKWKTSEDRLKEQLSSLLGKPCPRLRVIPIDRREAGIPIFKVAENTSSTTICLRAYTENVLVREKNEELELAAVKYKRKRKQSGGIIANLDPNDNMVQDPNDNMVSDPNDNMVPALSNKRLNLQDPNAADAENSDIESHFPGQFSTTVDNLKFYSDCGDLTFADEHSNAVAWMRFQKRWHDEEEDLENGINIGNLNQSIDAMNNATETDNDELDHDGEDQNDKLCACGSGKPAESETFVSHVWDDEKVKSGWTAEEAGILTIGEIYLMLGQTDKLCFEYRWDVSNEDRDSTRTRDLLSKLIAAARLLKKKKTSKAKAAHAVGSNLLPSCTTCGSKFETQAKENINVSPSIPTYIISPHHSKSSRAVGCLSSVLGDQLKSSFIGSTVSSVDPEYISGIHTKNNLKPVPINGSIKMSPEASDNIVTLHSVNPCETNEEAEMCFMGIVNSKIVQSKETDMTNEFTIDCKARHDQFTLLSGLNSQPTIVKSFLNSSSTGNFIELSSLATDPINELKSDLKSITSNVKATILPVSTCMIKSATGCVSIFPGAQSTSNNTMTVPEKNKDTRNAQINEKYNCISNPFSECSSIADNNIINTIIPNSSNTRTIHSCESFAKDQGSFRRPSTIPVAIKPKDDSSYGGESSQTLPPKPFLDLPKGNRRLGRRPNFKRVVVPRVLPLLPKQDEIIIRTSIPVSTILTVTASGVTSGIMTQSALPSGVFIPVSSLSVVPDSSITINSSSNSVINCTTMSNKKRTPLINESSGNTKISNPRMDSMDGRGLHNQGFLSGGPSSSSCNSNDFEDLLKVRRQDGSSNMAVGDMDGLSLSSFMEISLPESARMAANECINSDLHIEDLDNSNCSLGLSNLLSSTKTLLKEFKDLSTPDSSPRKLAIMHNAASSSEAPVLTNLTTFDTPWTLEPGDMSLSSIFGNYDTAAREVSGLSEGDMNFQFNEGSLDFVSKLSEISTAENRK